MALLGLGCLAAARDLDRLDDRLETLARGEADLRVQAAGASEALGRAQSEQAAAEEEMHLARQKLEELRRQHAADYLRRDLRAGDPCPVCLQAVSKVPSQAHPPLEQADARVKEAERGERQAREEVTRAEKALSALKQSLVDRRTQMDATRQERDRKEAELLEQLPPGQDRLPVALQAAVQEKESARANQEQLDRERQGLETELREKERLVNRAKQELSGLEASVRAADEALRKAEAEAASLSKDLSELAQARVWTEVCERLAAGRDPLPVMAARAQAVQQARDDSAARLAVLKDEVDRLARDIQRVKELRGEEEQRRQEWTVARELANLLRADRFQAFVQEEALRILAEDGTRHLEELSGGRYAFDVRGQEFLVADHWNADETRSVKTLSGGETFLASLALALALAERLPGLAGAQGQVTLESLFLDEGFGTLDVETLEVVAQALEALRSGNRMVCLITHIGELAERMPARIEVVKTQSGSHIAVS
jgi:exonuclease SbcC